MCKNNSCDCAGVYHTCAIVDDDGDASNGGFVKCWGNNDRGQTGGGTQNSDRNLTLSGIRGSPLGRTRATAITAGYWHTCAILSDGTVKCWGSNSSGQTGGGTQNSNGTLTLSGTAGDPLSSGTAKQIAAGYWHTCAILSDDTVKCWGSNSYGKTGGGTQNSDGNLTLSGTAGDPLSSGTAKQIAAGHGRTCAILSDDTVKCWGSNSSGQTGGGTQNSDGNLTLSGTAGDPLSGGTAKHIAPGEYHTCAILSDDTVKCWGSNSYGQTGGGTQNSNGTLTLSGTAGDPLSGGTAKHIAAGFEHTCAILSDGTVKCWGYNSSGQTDGGTPNLGIKLGTNTTHTAIAIATRYSHTCCHFR